MLTLFTLNSISCFFLVQCTQFFSIQEWITEFTQFKICNKIYKFSQLLKSGWKMLPHFKKVFGKITFFTVHVLIVGQGHLRTSEDGNFPLKKQHFWQTAFISVWNCDQMENEASSKYINQWFVLPIYICQFLKYMCHAPNPVPLQYASTWTIRELSKRPWQPQQNSSLVFSLLFHIKL